MRESAIRPPNPIQLLWYGHLGVDPPLAVSELPCGGDVARLMPHEDREFHQWFAVAHGFFWLPCPLCGRPFGGHEAGGSVPDPMKGEGWSLMVCSECVRLGNMKTRSNHAR